MATISHNSLANRMTVAVVSKLVKKLDQIQSEMFM